MIHNCNNFVFFLLAWDLSDPYLFVGEYLEMNCILDQETVEKGDNASKILFSYGNDIPVPEEEMVIVNSSTRGIRSLINSTFDRAYFCLLKANESETVVTASQTVATTMVETECKICKLYPFSSYLNLCYCHHFESVCCPSAIYILILSSATA